ncbi:hypothetical protein EK21DRAFT_106004 [Setomelanomma holmii]|uniref:Uncharacterized protein n=1 Tax=Setomelanomma holmii TaxID=210430 RepID=A0A9P4LQX7_9PLEO|nr:hypothetical protein EK21DRAFT_106004 [Setomelanomma holmii]
MATLNIAPDGEWNHDFSWDGHLMRIHIKGLKQDYDETDPRTWPLIKDIKSTDNGKSYEKSKLPPARLAYRSCLAKKILEYRSSRKDSKDDTKLSDGTSASALFVAYPYNFTRKGKLRQIMGIPPKELELWMRSVKSPVRSKTTRPKVTPRRRKTLTDDEEDDEKDYKENYEEDDEEDADEDNDVVCLSDVAPEIEGHSDRDQPGDIQASLLTLSPAAAFKQIMEFLAQSERSESKHVPELKEALKIAQENAVRYKGQVAEHAITMNNSREALNRAEDRLAACEGKAAYHANAAKWSRKALEEAGAKAQQHECQAKADACTIVNLKEALDIANVAVAEHKSEAVYEAASKVALKQEFQKDIQDQSAKIQKECDDLELRRLTRQYEEDLAQELQRTSATHAEVKGVKEKLKECQAALEGRVVDYVNSFFYLTDTDGLDTLRSEMAALDNTDLKRYGGDLQWGGDALHSDIRARDPGRDVNDLRTWSVINYAHLDHSLSTGSLRFYKKDHRICQM